MSQAVATIAPSVPAMSPAAVGKVRHLETLARQQAQVPFLTRHLLHAGLYIRTVTLPAGTVATGALVTAPTALILSGSALVYIGEDEPLRVTGHTVLPASAGRKQAFFTETEFSISMVAPCSARMVAEAEAMFTDEVGLLRPLADSGQHEITVTGE